MNSSEFLVTGIRCALQAGEILRRGFGTTHQVTSKPGKQNYVTELDKASEECIMANILHQHPTHSFLAEESGSTKRGKGDIIWLIDPLDGTVNFVRNIPVFTVSIAAAVGKETVCAVIYQPMVNELFFAEKGKGAFLNGVKLQVKNTSSLDQALLATGFPYNVDENPLSCIDKVSKILHKGIPIRRLGSAALDMAYVAAGRFDAFWEVSLHPWDYAAGKLIIEEAGGKVTEWNGSPYDLFSAKPILASNGALHKQMIEALK